MTFNAYEASRESGAPIQLYRFTYGTEVGEFFAYTDHTDEVVVDHGGSVGEIAYQPVPVERDEIVSNGTLDRSSMKLGLDVSTDLAELFRVYPPDNVVNLIVYQGHVDDPDSEFKVIWAGRVVSASRAHSELELQGEPISTQMKRPGLRRHYQYGCPHALYSTVCGANKAAATSAATVASISGTAVTLDAGWEGSLPPAKFLRGQFEWTPAGASTKRRTIIRVSGNVLTLSGLPLDLAADDAVNVVLGCNHHAFEDEGGDCEGLHDNIVNYGGCKWIPVKNIINRNPYY
ncbi:phage BR0599 family protein [Sphingobium sp. LMC3-1-1.1]|uniref:phage BR0599 family protein n=1 Tax=Sphingobium sp. LMC3-1-1.1 TaxID=3135241 RepID=UPI00342744A2